MKTKAILAILAAGLAGANLGAQQVDTVFATNSVYEPMGVASEGGYIYVTASVSNRIVRFNPATGALDVLAGSSTGQTGLVNSANGSLARFYSPQGILVARGGLVVSDSGNHSIRLVSFSGAVSTLAGTGAIGANNGAAASATFNNPVGMAVDASGNIYIADAGNGAIRILFTNDTVGTLATGFYQPYSVAVGVAGQVWVADTRNNVIKLVNTTGSGTAVTAVGAPIVAAGNPAFTPGGADSENALEAYFNSPRGLLWVGGSTGLLISDTGNNVLRKVVTNSVSGGYSSALVAGAYGESGNANGVPTAARFRSPVGLCRDTTSEGFLVVDRENAAVRRLQSSAPQPRIRNPRIGYIRLADTGSGYVAKLSSVTVITLHNEEVLGIDAEQGVSTYFTYGPTPADPLDTSAIADPGPGTGSTPPPFVDGQLSLPPTMLGPSPNFIVKARSSAQGRMASDVVQAQFIFKTASPTILGDNAASLPINNITDGARMFYTTNGLDPVDGATTNNFGPVSSGETISLALGTNNMTLKIRAFRDNFQPSDIVTKTLSPGDYSANKITFGFDAGEGSSTFVGAPGQRFIAPVTLSLLPGQKIYSLQFNATVTNQTGPAVTGSTLGFSTMLYALYGVVYFPIPPFVDATNTGTGNLMLGWHERYGQTNFFPTLLQDLVTYSIAHNIVFKSDAGKVIVGGFSFQVPTTAAVGSEYKIRLGRPSATSDGVQKDAYIDTPTNGPITAEKVITIGQREYVAGDCMPFGWFNAGDFGDSNLLSADLQQVFQTIVYGLNMPAPGTDFFDAMDSCCGDTNGVDQSGNALFVSSNGVDTIIDTLAFGNGTLAINDLFVTFRRGLDPSRVWYARYWPTNGALGARQFKVVSNQYRGSTGDRTAIRYTMGGDTAPMVRVTAGDLTPVPGQLVEVPITAAIAGGLPLRALALGIMVEALDGSPAITENISFIPSAAFGTPAYADNRSASQIGLAWLNLSRGLEASGEIGRLVVRIPATATANSAYKIAIRSFSGSPNGVGLFPSTLDNGLMTLSDRSTSTAGDGIPDAWKLRHFNTLNNELSRALADADGDGVPNWAEFRAGTNPNDAASKLQMLTRRSLVERTVSVRWPTAAGKRYVIESSDSLSGGEWTPVASDIVGDGLLKEFKDTDPGAGLRFYRVRVTE